MKRSFILFNAMLMLFFLKINCQKKKPIKQEIITIEKAVVNHYIELIFKVNLKPFWVIYSVNTKSRNSKNSSLWFNESERYSVSEKPEALYEVEVLNNTSNKK